MANEILFLSDVHLALEKPRLTQRLLKFLEQRAPRATALYILGDLFDAWIGDDDPTPPGRWVKQRLRALSDQGVAIFVQPGNRDFLLGERFARETGAQLLDDYAVIDLFGVPTLVTHGDLLCTDDHAYQAFRAKSRTPQWRANVLAKPWWLRWLAARWYRLRSGYHKARKSAAIMDVNQATVEAVMRAHDVDRLIHGHTHRPAVHEWQSAGVTKQRYVLAEWQPHRASILCWRADGPRVETC